MTTALHTTHTINLTIYAYDQGRWLPLPYRSAETVTTCDELQAAVRAAGTISGALIRMTRFQAFRVEARENHGALIALSEYHPSYRPGHPWEAANPWTSCESGACSHAKSLESLQLAA